MVAEDDGGDGEKRAARRLGLSGRGSDRWIGGAFPSTRFTLFSLS